MPSALLDLAGSEFWPFRGFREPQCTSLTILTKWGNERLSYWWFNKFYRFFLSSHILPSWVHPTVLNWEGIAEFAGLEIAGLNNERLEFGGLENDGMKMLLLLFLFFFNNNNHYYYSLVYASENTYIIKQLINIAWRQSRTAKTSSLTNGYSIYSNTKAVAWYIPSSIVWDRIGASRHFLVRQIPVFYCPAISTPAILSVIFQSYSKCAKSNIDILNVWTNYSVSYEIKHVY